MAKVNTSHLLESVVRLTSQRDQHSLECCLIQTMQELISAETITLYEILDVKGVLSLKVIVETPISEQSSPSQAEHDTPPLFLADDPDLLACFSSGKQIVSQGNANECIRVIHPVMGIDEVIGFLIIKCKTLVPKDQTLADSFLRIHHNYLLLLNDNDHDTLTGLLNRKTFEDRIQKLLHAQKADLRRTSDSGGNYCLAILDIDHFKRINDKFGHLYGDEVLLMFSRLMTQAFRDSDLLFRYGGEEFVVVLKDVDLELALMILERFRRTVESFKFSKVTNVNVTVSIGTVQIAGQNSPAFLVEEADQALYYAKDNGRNRVCSYEKLLAEKKLAVTQYQTEIDLL